MRTGRLRRRSSRPAGARRAGAGRGSCGRVCRGLRTSCVEARERARKPRDRAGIRGRAARPDSSMSALFDDARPCRMTMASLLDIHALEAARGGIDPVHLDTPVASNPELEAVLGCRLLAKIETANPIGSFKGRGADWFVATALAPGEAVVCASAGNFGQGLARACARRGHACTVFVSHAANPLKVDALRRFGADVRVSGDDFDAAKD